MSSSDLAILHDRCVKGLLACVDNAAQHLDSDKKSPQFKILEKIVDDYCKYEYRNRVFDSTKNHMKANMTPDIRKSSDNGLDVFIKTMDDKVKSLKKPKIHPIMENFKSKTNLGDNTELNDSDLITTECTENYIDPFSKKQIQKPVKNKICGHIYEESSITELLKLNKRLRCPIMGCGNRTIIQPGSCVLDEVVMMRLTQLNES